MCVGFAMDEAIENVSAEEASASFSYSHNPLETKTGNAPGGLPPFKIPSGENLLGVPNVLDFLEFDICFVMMIPNNITKVIIEVAKKYTTRL